jgi:uncharacterized protein (DUF433 family)
MSRFTALETAVLADVDVKTVHNVIEDVLPEIAGPARTLSATDAVIVKLATSLTPYLTREAKRRFAHEIRHAPHRRQVSLDVLGLDVARFRAFVAERMQLLRTLRHLATTEEGILGGEPVFRGTRVPVAMIAAMVEAGEAVADIRAGYPQLGESQIALAPLWVKTYPRRGRPRPRPWAEADKRAKRTARRRAEPAA